MGYEIIDEYSRESDEPATIIAWISEPGQRDIGLRAVLSDDLSLELIEFSDKTNRECRRVYIGHEEFETLLKLRDYAKGKWGYLT